MFHGKGITLLLMLSIHIHSPLITTFWYTNVLSKAQNNDIYFWQKLDVVLVTEDSVLF